MPRDELIPIVDSNDKVIGEAPMREAWSKGLVHRVSRVVLENNKGEILLQKRAPQKEIFPNCWGTSAAGHVDPGESYEQAARRELFEELGIEDVKLLELGKFYVEFTFKGRIMKRFVTAYKLYTDQTPTQLQETEVSAVKWFRVSDIKEMINDQPELIEDGIQQIIERYYK